VVGKKNDMKIALKKVYLWISIFIAIMACPCGYASEETTIEEYFKSFSAGFYPFENKQFQVAMTRILTGDALNKEMEWYDKVSSSGSQRYEPRHFSLKNVKIESIVKDDDKVKVTVKSVRADNDSEILPFINIEIANKIKTIKSRVEEIRLSGHSVGKGWYAKYNTLEEYLFYFDHDGKIFKIDNQILSCEFQDFDPESFND
jgi:hypothetical protein